LTVYGYNNLHYISGRSRRYPVGEVTSFDHIVAVLGLGPDQYKDSLPLKEWVRLNKDEKYVPTDLLKHWGFQEDEAA
jgi:hypothetical protein